MEKGLKIAQNTSKIAILAYIAKIAIFDVLSGNSYYSQRHANNVLTKAYKSNNITVIKKKIGSKI